MPAIRRGYRRSRRRSGSLARLRAGAGHRIGIQREYRARARHVLRRKDQLASRTRRKPKNLPFWFMSAHTNGFINPNAGRPPPRVVRETEAEAVAFVVSKAIGLNPKSSASYIQLYHGNAELLMESLEVVQQTSAVILAAITMEKLAPPETKEPQTAPDTHPRSPRNWLLARTGRYRRGSTTSRLIHARANRREQAMCVCPHDLHHHSDQ